MKIIQGSIRGGTVITITGDGFNNGTEGYVMENMRIELGSNTYSKKDIIFVSYNTIKFRTKQNAVGNFEIRVAWDSVKAIADRSRTNATFRYSTMINVNSVSPLSISKSSIITLNGNNFGNDSSIVNVTIGEERCQVISINNTQMECFLEALQVGLNELQVYFEGIS